MTLFSISVTWSLAYGTTPSCRNSATNETTRPTASSGATIRTKRDAAGLQRRDLALAGEPLHREQRAEQHRHRDDQQDVARQFPEKIPIAAHSGACSLRDEPADRQELRRGEDQRERRQPESERAAELRDQIAVENRTRNRRAGRARSRAMPLTAGSLRPDRTCARPARPGRRGRCPRLRSCRR